MLRVEEQTAYKDAMSATYAALGGGGGRHGGLLVEELAGGLFVCLAVSQLSWPRLVAPETDAGGLLRRQPLAARGCRRPRCVVLASSASLCKLSACVET